MSNLNSPPRNLSGFVPLPASNYAEILNTYCERHNKVLEEMSRRLKLPSSHAEYPNAIQQVAFEAWHTWMHNDMNHLRIVITAMHN